MTLAKLMGMPYTVTATGDGNIVNTGIMDNRRGVVASGSASVDQSLHFRLGTGGIVIAIIAVLLLIGGATTAIVIQTNGPTYPELEGNWNFAGHDGGVAALHFTDDTFTFDAVGLGQLHCSGTIKPGKDERTYLLVSNQGACPRATVTIDQEDQILMFAYGSDAPDFFSRESAK